MRTLVKILRKNLKNDSSRILLQNLETSYAAAEKSLEKIEVMLLRRQWLIDEQIRMQDFRTPLHEEYHELSEAITDEIRNYYTLLKRVLDRVAQLLDENLLSGSNDTLQKLVNTIKKDKSHELFNLILPGSEAVIEIANYRNNFIEHPKKFEDHFFTSQMEAKIGYSDGAISSPSAVTDDELCNAPGSKFVDTMKVGLGDENYVVYVHVNPVKMEEGSHIEKGDTIAVWSDGGSGHFDRYGAHMHQYFSPGFFEKYDNPRAKVEGSPPLRGSYQKVERYVLKLLRNIRKRT